MLKCIAIFVNLKKNVCEYTRNMQPKKTDQPNDSKIYEKTLKINTINNFYLKLYHNNK